jgi:hypothetical protein
VYLAIFVLLPYSVLFAALIVLADDEDRPRTIAVLSGLAAALRESADTDLLLGSAPLTVLASLRVARDWWRGRQGQRYLH